MAETPSWTPFVALVVVVAIGAAGAGAFVWYHDRPVNPPTTALVQLGNNVTVNYIGIFGSGPQQGKVFDTSLYRVATDNVAYPKSLFYSPRGVEKNYTTLDVHVGNVPSSGYTLGNLSFIQVVTGFWQGLVGMAPNQTRTVTVPPSLGYGAENPACTATLPITQRLPIVQTMPGSQFQKQYPGALAATGSQFDDPHYGWTVVVLSANSSYVTVENLPHVGETASPAGWPVVVTNITTTANGSGQITLENQLGTAAVGTIVGHDFLGTGPCSSANRGEFLISSVNLVNGTYTEDFNKEVVGQTLLFVITVIDNFAPVPVVQ